jgi:hypothetical protein
MQSKDYKHSIMRTMIEHRMDLLEHEYYSFLAAK